ncbi:hypothetical protein KAI56_03415 [Candidatus Parcubacteria bacterium]|nr:hypothetical protein [Candidatus Parcubacteria bacterium]
MGILRDIIEENDFLVRANDIVKTNNHHFTPASVVEEIERKKEHGMLTDEEIELLKELDFSLTIIVLIWRHNNYNNIFAGDFLSTEVLGKLKFQILYRNYCICRKKKSKNENKKIELVRFLFFVSEFKGVILKEDEIDAIDMRLEKRCIIPVCFLEAFHINQNDIIDYLEKYFLYPNHKKYCRQWEILSRMGHIPDREKKADGNGFHNKLMKGRI